MSLIDLSIRRRVTIAMFTLAVLLFGGVSLSRLSLNLLPDLTFPTLTVRTAYDGAAPAEVENLISKPVEEALGVVKNLVKIESISRTGQSDVVLEFAWGADIDVARMEVREKLDALQLPLEAERPVLLRFDPSLDPIMRFGLFRKPDAPLMADAGATPVALAGDDRATEEPTFNDSELKQLRRFADEQLKKDLESTAGVAAVKISGGLEDEVQVLLDQKKLSQLNLTTGQVVQVLSAENVNLSGGRLEEGVQEYLVRTVNEFGTVEEIGDVIIVPDGNAPVYLHDIATVNLGYKEREAITRINGREAVEVAIYKEGDANTVDVARNIERRLEAIQSSLPSSMAVEKVYDQSTFIESAVNEVVNAGLFGGLLAIFILYLFLRDFRTTVIISVSIPVSIIATFNMMYGFDLSLNIMSLGGLALGIGMLVDNSIVVLENIARHRELGASPVEAARTGATEVTQAVVASTLTTIAVFFPLVFVQGIAGQLFRDQALTVTFSLLASLLVAITLIPMMASLRKTGVAEPPPVPVLKEPKTRFGRAMRTARLAVFQRFPDAVARYVYGFFRLVSRGARIAFSPLVAGFNAGYGFLAARYLPLLRWSLGHRAVVLGLALLAFGGSLALVPRLGIELIPQLTQGEFNVSFRLAPGTPLEQTDQVLTRMQRAALDVPAIQSSFAVAGTGNRMDANPDQGGENWGEVHIALDPAAGSDGEATAMDALRTSLRGEPGVQYEFSYPTLFTFDTPIEIEVSGYDLTRLKEVSQAIAAGLADTDRFADVKSTMETGNPEVQIFFDRDRAAALGLPVHELARRVVSSVRGDVATRYSWRDRKIDVLVRVQERDRQDIDRIRELIINPESDRPIPLSAVAEVVVNVGPGEIRRVGQERVAIVSANLAYGDLGAAAEEIDAVIGRVAMPAGLSVRLSGQSEEMTRSFRSLLFALVLAVFLVYLIMASQFESLLHPLIIFFSIPLALIGAVLALWVTGSTISVVVFIGMILLAGIVVNNAIILVDVINQLRQDGMPRAEAVLEAGRLRLRPILMTTLTTVLGLAPLALGIGDGAEIRAPMAITVIGGLSVSTLLTLVVIPVMYTLVDRKPDATPTTEPT
ncbi:MAG: efflux RND transporter permease subunit [Rhodothermales bacterium]|nr:efflux RND transporter permease subunit [Rhodothermales bacterium]